MIVVRVELWPCGDKTKAESLGVAVITNDGTGTNTKRNYDVSLYSAGEKPKLLRSSRLIGWNSPKVSAWRTVFECLKKVFERI